MFLKYTKLIPGELYSIYPKINSTNDTLIPLGLGMFVENVIKKNFQLTMLPPFINVFVDVTYSVFLIKNEKKEFESEFFSFLLMSN